MKKCKTFSKKIIARARMLLAALLVGVLSPIHLMAQDGLAGINEANDQIRSYFDAGTELMYGIGAVLGLIGAVKV